ncbi:MAG: NAD-dependent epimerase/dehydratase family protein [Oscillospiraceae bacterium]|nr:NAD-dependent epimerase/dehydratase family protein [Oscillospiraceae bacterium]
MKKVLVTGGTVFVSRYVAEYYVKKGFEVYVLNRNTRAQPAGTTLIEADRHDLGDRLRHEQFDVVFDVTAYTAQDVNMLLDAIGSYGLYIMISSSAVYPESAAQPFSEETPLGENKFWGKYGTDKIEGEAALVKRDPNAYILRPPYLYGPMNNVYREAFVFACAMGGRKFYLPRDGEMGLQFFHVDDLCRFMDVILARRPDRHIFNVGNPSSVSIREWVTMCYRAVGKQPDFVRVHQPVAQRNYFCFYDYEYELDVREQERLMPKTRSMEDGLKESAAWYLANQGAVREKPLIAYIDHQLLPLLIF